LVSEYFWYDPFNSEDFLGFFLNSGVYQPLVFNEQGWLISQSLGLALVRWSGTLSGEVLLTGRELAEQEHESAEQERSRADRLAEKLRSLGINLDVDI
jgi:hypothetical protein